MSRQADTFISVFLKLFNGWDMERFSGTVSEYMKVYEEVFADLGMCAAFRFSRVGYGNYIVEKFSYEREKEKSEGKSITRERLRLVFAVLGEPEKDEKLAEKNSDGKDLGETEERWREEIESLMKKQPRAGKHDAHFKEVFTKQIVNADWVKACRENDVVQAIGKYYNSSYEEGGNEKEEMGERFFDDFKKRNDKREQAFNKIKEGGSESAIAIMLEEVDGDVKL